MTHYLGTKRFLGRLAVGVVVSGSLLAGCGSNVQDRAYENLQRPPTVKTAAHADTESTQQAALLEKGFGDKIKLKESARGSVLVFSLDKNTAFSALESALEHHQINVIDQAVEQGYFIFEVKDEQAADTVPSDSADEHFGSDGVYSSGEGFLDNIGSLWGSKSKAKTPAEATLRYRLSAKQEAETTVFSLRQMATSSVFKKRELEQQNRLMSMLYNSLRDGFAAK